MPFRPLETLLRSRATVVRVLACMALAWPAYGQDALVDGQPVPERVVSAGQSLVLNGVGLRTILGFHVYVAALYLPGKVHDPETILFQDQPRQMRVTLLHGVTTEQNLERLKTGLIANNSAAELAAIQADVDRFLALLHQVRDLPAGTVILFDYLPGSGTRVWVGSHDLGVVPGVRFNRAVLRIWLGDDPVQISLKKALLGLERST